MDDLIGFYLANKLLGEEMANILLKQVSVTIGSNICWMVILFLTVVFGWRWFINNRHRWDAYTLDMVVMLMVLCSLLAVGAFLALLMNTIGMILNPNFYVLQVLVG